MKRAGEKSEGSPNPAPKRLSNTTVALMIQLFEYLFQGRGPLSRPLFDISKLPTVLFGMGFSKDFLSTCEWQYGWNFSWLLPSLYDGSFHKNVVYGESLGQGDLRGFATFLCGTFADAPHLRTEINASFERSLKNDGYEFINSSLVETNVDTTTPPELAALPKKIALLNDVSVQLQMGIPVAVLFLDLDHFKNVNDQGGHAEGDRCLVEVVRSVARVLLHKGKLYRVGGDEFCAMLPNFTISETAATAERLRAAVDALKPFGGVKVTASIGCAVSDGDKLSTPEALLEAADSSMYVAKFTTKNRISLWPPDPDDAALAATNRGKSRTTR